jgi:pimeloyl-ACP methyl ester carboxylesterase
MTATTVLVHGAWHGAWCWDRVIEGLAAKGLPSVAVDLPGHGRDTGPLGDLHGDAARVGELLDELAATGSDVVLVGHSYGGAVITEAGVHPAVRHLVYLCALALAEDESCATVAVGDATAAAISHEGRPNLSEALVIDEDGLATLAPLDRASACLYNQCDPETASSALSRLGPQPMVTLQQVPDAVAWRGTPSTYVVCANDFAVHPDLQRVMAARCSRQVEWESDHSPFLSHPELVTDLLAEIAAS